MRIMTDDTVKLALKYFSSDYNCSQAVMKSILENEGMDFDEIFHLAAGFGGGFGLEGHICGAVSGAVAAIGVLNGRNYSDDIEQRKTTYPIVKKFLKRSIQIIDICSIMEVSQVNKFLVLAGVIECNRNRE